MMSAAGVPRQRSPSAMLQQPLLGNEPACFPESIRLEKRGEEKTESGDARGPSPATYESLSDAGNVLSPATLETAQDGAIRAQEENGNTLATSNTDAQIYPPS